jgi:hypothetical protein
MDMIQKILVSLGLALVLILTSIMAFAEPPQGMVPPPGMPPMMGPASMVSDNQHLYVLAGPKIMQYSLGDLKLLKTVDLPKPTLPKEKIAMLEDEDCPEAPGCPCPPPFPPMGGSQALLASEGSLYVLVGPMLYRFSTPDLALKTTAEMPKPELPKPEPPKAEN